MADSLSTIVGKALSSSGVAVRIRSRISPPVTLSTGGSGGGAARFLRPAVDILDADGNVLESVAPYGDPGTGTPGTVAAVAVLTLAALGLLYLATRKH